METNVRSSSSSSSCVESSSAAGRSAFRAVAPPPLTSRLFPCTDLLGDRPRLLPSLLPAAAGLLSASPALPWTPYPACLAHLLLRTAPLPADHKDVFLHSLGQLTAPPGTTHLHGKKLFGCPQCRYMTDRKNNLKRHVSTMHQACDKPLECCGVVFKNKAMLRDHVLLFHSNGYMCRYCGRNFCRKALLKRHLSVHSGQKDFMCADCDYATSHKSNLERHRRVHDRPPGEYDAHPDQPCLCSPEAGPLSSTSGHVTCRSHSAPARVAAHFPFSKSAVNSVYGSGLHPEWNARMSRDASDVTTYGVLIPRDQKITSDSAVNLTNDNDLDHHKADHHRLDHRADHVVGDSPGDNIDVEL